MKIEMVMMRMTAGVVLLGSVACGGVYDEKDPAVLETRSATVLWKPLSSL